MGERIFADDWRACQEEHLRAVMAAGDARNEASLLRVMQDIGFDEARLAELGVIQNAPEMPAAEAAESAAPAMEPEPEVAAEIPEVDVDLPPQPETGVAADMPDGEAELPPEEEMFADDPPAEPGGPAQLSLF